MVHRATPVVLRRALTETVPLQGGNGSLPAPSAGLTLKTVALGRGTQNYTCESSTATPVNIGALANLTDLTVTDSVHWDALTTMAVGYAHNRMPVLSTPLYGWHVFDSAGSPTFNIPRLGISFVGKKLADVTAPARSVAGPDGTGSVDWLQLGDKGTSVGAKEVYRVKVAGGKAPKTCEGQPNVIFMEYAAQYWFYG
ncbi:MAG: hypothetical protein M1838_002947 [Thelocarpon superellum]|nr:MAG: hypothetical protein M1838_002947 [Thelocarpon superellum]